MAVQLRRILILPRWLCYVDKLWAGSDNIIATGFMYPGSQDAPFLPFACPWITLSHEWAAAQSQSQQQQQQRQQQQQQQQQQAPLRPSDAAFLSSPRLSRAIAGSIVDLVLQAATTGFQTGRAQAAHPG